MTEDKGILIKNIYWMLAYAFQVLRQDNYSDVLTQDFKEVKDLFAALLSRGISQQVKQGLYKEYVDRQEVLPVLKGKLDIRGTIRERMSQSMNLSCEFDDLTHDNIYNRILKTAALILVNDFTVDKKWRDALRQDLAMMSDIGTVPPDSIDWSRLRFQRSNESYRMLINICHLLLSEMIFTTDKGEVRVRSLSDDQMHTVYEKFILNYYRKEYRGVIEASAAEIKWDFDEGHENDTLLFMPRMHSDITLRYQDRTLIIDAKYYGSVMQSNYDKEMARSAHLYQLYSYVKNSDVTGSGKVSGMLLYAQTKEGAKDYMTSVGGNRLYIRTLDLGQEFDCIKGQLDRIVQDEFGI